MPPINSMRRQSETGRRPVPVIQHADRRVGAATDPAPAHDSLQLRVLAGQAGVGADLLKPPKAQELERAIMGHLVSA